MNVVAHDCISIDNFRYCCFLDSLSWWYFINIKFSSSFIHQYFRFCLRLYCISVYFLVYFFSQVKTQIKKEYFPEQTVSFFSDAADLNSFWYAEVRTGSRSRIIYKSFIYQKIHIREHVYGMVSYWNIIAFAVSEKNKLKKHQEWQ